MAVGEQWQDALRASLRALDGRRLDARADERRAAVLVPLMENRSGLVMVVEKRSTQLPHHAGQYAFPGGALEARDGSPAECALREAEEEIALAPADVDILGVLSDLRTPTGFVITPVVGAIRGTPRLVPSPDEVEFLVSVPVAHVMRPDAFQVVSHRAVGLLLRGEALVWEGHVIWGATARILLGLRRLLRATDGPWSTGRPSR